MCSKHVEECNKCIEIKNLCIKLVEKEKRLSRNNVLLQVTELLSLATCLCRTTVRMSHNKLPVPTKRETVSVIQVTSRNALLRMLLVLCVSSYLKSFVRHKSSYIYIYIYI